MLGTVKPCTKHTTEISEKKEKKQNGVELFLQELINEFHLMKHINPQIQNALQTLKRINKKKTIPNITEGLKKTKDK